jgi:dipeptidyl aminopeptidase/acylaminoacyl peptidase
MENGLRGRYPWRTMQPSHRRLFAAIFVISLAASLDAARSGRDANDTGPGPAAEQAAREFTAEDMLKVTSASVLDLSDDGRRVAVSVRRAFDNAEVDNRRFGDPTYVPPSQVKLLVIDTQSGATDTPFADLVNVRQAAWSHDGRRLAVLTVSNTAPAGLYIWDAVAKTRAEVPHASPLAEGSGLEWAADDSRLIVALRKREEDNAAAARFKALTEGPIIVQSSKDPFLDWDDLQRATRTRSIALLDPATGAATTILPERKVSSYRVTRDSRLITFMEDVTEKTDYDVIGGTMNTLRSVDVPGATGSGQAAPRTIAEAKDLKEVQLRWSDDGRTFAYAKKGEVFVQGISEAKARSLTPRPKDEKTEETKEGEETKENAKKPEPESFSVGLFSRDASKLLITSKKGWYVVNVADGARAQVLTLDPDKEEKNPKVAALAWALDGSSIYLTYSAPDKWERGVMRLPLGRAAGPATSVLEPLIRDARLYTGAQMSHDGGTFVMGVSDGDRPADLFASDREFRNLRRLTDLNAQLLAGVSVPRSELVAYRDADGKELYGVLRYPVNYVKGQKYPTIFELYETFFDNGFNARAAFLASHGYAVFHPSVNLVVGRPGEAWVKGVTAAANRLIDLGVADPDRLGVQGTSYGGYATVLLITQTDRFKAAVNVSGKVDMVSFYTDSPRLGVRNTHAPEKSQDRIGGTLWEYPERYLDHSAILHADRIKTPLLTISGDQDPNVPASQSREIYYALRRLGKDVEWVRYVNGAHRPPNSVAESVDFENRILAWYEKYLKADAAKKKTTTE